MKIVLEISKEELDKYLFDSFGDLKLRITEMTPENHTQVKKYCKLCKGKCNGWSPFWHTLNFKVLQILPVNP